MKKHALHNNNIQSHLTIQHSLNLSNQCWSIPPVAFISDGDEKGAGFEENILYTYRLKKNQDQLCRRILDEVDVLLRIVGCSDVE